MTDTTVSEIVTFRLKAHADADAFVAAAATLTPFLKSTGAVLSRTLSVDDAGLWTDHITWVSLAQAKRAAKALLERPEAGPFLAMIAPSAMEMRHAAILLSFDREAHATD